MIYKVFDTEVKAEEHFDPNICELSLLCEDINGKIYTINDIEHDMLNSDIRKKYDLIYHKHLIKESRMIEKTIQKYPFDNVKKWFGIFYYEPKLFPNDIPLKEIVIYFEMNEYLKLVKRNLTDQEITEIIDIINNYPSKMLKIYELYKIIDLGYTKIIDKINSKMYVDIGKFMVSKNNVNLELLKKIKIGGPNQVIWIIKNKLYPLLNLGNFSKKTWIEAKDTIVRNIHKILPFIDKKTFDIIEPIIEWNKYKEKKPDELMYMINGGYRIILKYFNYNTDKDVMKEIYKKFYASNPNYDIFEAQFDFCFRISRIDNIINDISDVRKKIELWKKVEYALS